MLLVQSLAHIGRRSVVPDALQVGGLGPGPGGRHQEIAAEVEHQRDQVRIVAPGSDRLDPLVGRQLHQAHPDPARRGRTAAVVLDMPLPKLVDGNRIQQRRPPRATPPADLGRAAPTSPRRCLPPTTPRSDCRPHERRHPHRSPRRHRQAVQHAERDTEADAVPVTVPDRVRALPVLDRQIRGRVADDTIGAVGNFHADRMLTRPGSGRGRSHPAGRRVIVHTITWSGVGHVRLPPEPDPIHCVVHTDDPGP